MCSWVTQLKVNPVPALLSCGNNAVAYFARRDLMEETVEPIDSLWRLPEVQKVFQKQQADGSWKHKGTENVTYPSHHYPLVQTWKTYRELVEHYQVTKDHEGARRACEFLFTCQTPQGDIRGMLANQYATYYTGAILAILIKSGYQDDPRVIKGLDWLLSMRQDDGGWTIPMATYKLSQKEIYRLTSSFAEPLEPDRTKPFSHNWTDMALRAFAAHPTYRHNKAALKAAELLKSRFFQPDVYTSYQDPGYWVRFAFWWPNLVTSLDSLSLMGFSKDDPEIKKALKWLAENQMPDSLWNLDYAKRNGTPATSEKSKQERLWLTLTVARIIKRFYQ